MTQMHPSIAEAQKELASLESRVKALEDKRTTPVEPSLNGDGPPHATDPFAVGMYVRALAAGFRSTKFIRAPDDYYSWPLEKRRQFLSAPHTSHLTKSIVMENTRHNGESDPKDALRSRYLCIVTPYDTKIDSDRLRAIIRGMYKSRGLEIPSAKQFNYRLVADCVGVTGYEYNSVMPLGLLTDMPIVLAKELAGLKPAEFWMGGGEVSMKWKVTVDEFCNVFNPVIIDFTVKPV